MRVLCMARDVVLKVPDQSIYTDHQVVRSFSWGTLRTKSCPRTIMDDTTHVDDGLGIQKITFSIRILTAAGPRNTIMPRQDLDAVR